MAHYAFLDENNIVTEVIVGKNESNFDWERYYGDLKGQVCKRTSFNTYGNSHNNQGIPFRGNYAGIGYYYDNIKDAFIAPKPFESWILNELTLLWESPVPYPTDGQFYYWDESNKNWEVVLNS
jgi:hypothetical protein